MLIIPNQTKTKTMANAPKPSIKLMALLEPITAQGKEILSRPKVQTQSPIDWKNLPHADRARLMNEARARKKELTQKKAAYMKDRMVRNNLVAVGLTLDKDLHQRIQIQAKFDNISVQECYRSVITIGLLTIQANAIASTIKPTSNKGATK
jgi:hypothetical protein